MKRFVLLTFLLAGCQQENDNHSAQSTMLCKRWHYDTMIYNNQSYGPAIVCDEWETPFRNGAPQ